MSVHQIIRRSSVSSSQRGYLPRKWRWFCIAAGTLMLCSCQSLPGIQQGEGELPPMAGASTVGDTPSAMMPQPNMPQPGMPHPGMMQPGMMQPGMMQQPGLPNYGMMPPKQPGQGMPPGMDMISMYGMRPTQVPAGAQQNASGVMPVSYNERINDEEYYSSLPIENTTGLPYDPTLGYAPSQHMPGYPGIPLPQDVYSNWSPPGIAQPWPRIEYLRDGGDRLSPAGVDRDWNIAGLETEDTIAHYDTVDGLTHVEPSNRVHIYAPRFAGVRSVTSSARSDQITRMDRFNSNQQIVGVEANQLAATHLQQEQLHADIGSRHVEAFERSQYDDIYSRAQIAGEASDRFLPFEDLSIIRQGIHQQTDQARLQAGMDAAITWAHDTEVQVVLNDVTAVIEEQIQSAEVVYTVNAQPGPSKLRVVKVASTNYAKPGEVIDFTIRFDNVGAQVIGNVTIIDNLTTRLEYVEGTAQSSLPGEFFTDPNEGDSLRLRWEITDPLMQGKGGVIRFQCRVR